MAYGTILADIHQSSTAGTPPLFYDGNSAQIGTLCRAWVNFNGVTTTTIRASFNVSSVTRNSTGYYTVNFSTAFADANYGSAINFQWDAANSTISANGSVQTYRANATQGQTTGGISLISSTAAGVATDMYTINVAIFR